jgi:hypothetical protein
VLPAWATVAIALGGSFLTAVASLGVAYLTKKHESVAEWRKLMVEVGEDFSTGVGQATRGVREALRLAAPGFSFMRAKPDRGSVAGPFPQP